jgi:hypothetical protein
MLQHPKENLKITDKLVDVFVTTKCRGIMKLLLQYRGQDVNVSEAVIKKAISKTDGAWVLECLKRDQEKCIAITERILVAIAGHAEILRLLVATRGTELPITPQVLIAAVEGELAYKIMLLLLQENNYDVVVTEDVVKVASRNIYCAKEILELLLDSRGDEVLISEEIVMNAARNYSQGGAILKLLLEKRRNEVKVSKEVVGVCYHPEAMWQLLDRLEDFGTIPDEIRTAIPEKWDTREKIRRDIVNAQKASKRRRRRQELEERGRPHDYDDSDSSS